MFVFWYENSFQTGMTQLNTLIQKELSAAAKETCINPDQAKKHRQLANGARGCLEGLIEIKHFLYFDHEPSEQFVQLIVKYYHSNTLTQRELTELNQRFNRLALRLSEETPSYRHELRWHRVNYLVWAIAGALFASKMLNNPYSLLNLGASFSFLMIAIEGLSCNFSIRHGMSLEKIESFIKLLTEREQELHSDIENNYKYC